MSDSPYFRATLGGSLLGLLLIFGACQPAAALASESERIRNISTNDINSYLLTIY